MNRLSATTWFASVALHALVLVPFVSFATLGRHEIYDEGTGNDSFRTEQGLTVEMVSMGDAAERIEIAEVTPQVVAPTPPPVAETKPEEPELRNVITATEAPNEVATVTEEPKPPAEQAQPVQVAAIPVQEQEAVVLEKSAGKAEQGGKASALSAYVGKIHGALQKAKAPAGGGSFGRVTLGFTLDRTGKILDHEVLESSGTPSLDRAALEWLERAAFPPLPELLGQNQRFNVPLTFKRKSG